MTIDGLIAIIQEFCNDDSSNLIEVDDAFKEYDLNTKEYKELNATELCKRTLKIISNGGLKEPYYFFSALLSLTGDTLLFEELVRLCLEDSLLSKEQRLFVYSQLGYYRFTHPEVNNETIRELLDDLYDIIFQDFLSETDDILEPITKEERNKDFIIVLISQVLTLSHGPTKTLLDRCYVLEKLLKKKIYIINTADVLPINAVISWFDIVSGQYDSELSKLDYLEYRGCRFPYLQCPVNMPQISIIRDILTMVKEEKPWCIVSIGGGNLTADLCSRIVPVLTVSLAPSERTECRTTFQMTGKKPDDNDRKWLGKNGLADDHFIQGLFTSAFKEQVTHFTRKDLGLPEERKICLVVGARLDEEVTSEFVDVIKRLAKEGIITAFMGMFSLYENVCAADECLKENTVFLGFQDDAMAVYECCDIYLNPRRLGGGTSGAEALYKGIPVLTLNYGDVAIGVGEDFWVEDYDEMYSKALRLATDADYYDRMRIKAKERADALTDSESEFVRIIKEMERRKSFY